MSIQGCQSYCRKGIGDFVQPIKFVERHQQLRLIFINPVNLYD